MPETLATLAGGCLHGNIDKFFPREVINRFRVKYNCYRVFGIGLEMRFLFKINFTSSARKSIILTLFALFLLSCIFLLMVGSTFHTASPPDTYLGVDNSGDTAAQRIHFLTQLGYTVNSSSEESENIKIPEEFGDVYNRYNELQKQSGTNLLNYRGADCVRYTYTEEGSDRRFNLIVYEGRIIGGDVCTVALDGEMSALEKTLA
ncbi:MAG: DUF4830 domain-containing protein [Clostridia bacterium]|nr:DUF4830 domain-containing protein [Clostridia bacterium]